MNKSQKTLPSCRLMHPVSLPTGVVVCRLWRRGCLWRLWQRRLWSRKCFSPSLWLRCNTCQPHISIGLSSSLASLILIAPTADLTALVAQQSSASACRELPRFARLCSYSGAMRSAELISLRCPVCMCAAVGGSSAPNPFGTATPSPVPSRIAFGTAQQPHTNPLQSPVNVTPQNPFGGSSSTSPALPPFGAGSGLSAPALPALSTSTASPAGQGQPAAASFSVPENAPGVQSGIGNTFEGQGTAGAVVGATGVPTQDDDIAWTAPTFESGKIPETPPPAIYCR